MILASSLDTIVCLPISSQNNDSNGSFEMFSNSLSKRIENLSVNKTNTTNELPLLPLPPTNVSRLEMTPDVNHALTIDHQNIVINLGQSLSSGITNAIVRPLTFFNNLIGSAAGSLPGLFAANGAALGTAIATPIQLGTLAANAAISGITGTVVSIPISLASGGAAQLVGLIGTGRQLWHSTLGSDPNNSTFWQNGELWLQPLAVVTGTNSILAGVGLNALSQGVKNLGWSIERFGVSLSNTGKNAKQFGSVLIGWANGKPLYASIINETDSLKNSSSIVEEINQQQQPMDTITKIDLDKMIPLNLESESTIETTTTTMVEIENSQTQSKNADDDDQIAENSIHNEKTTNEITNQPKEM